MIFSSGINLSPTNIYWENALIPNVVSELAFNSNSSIPAFTNASSPTEIKFSGKTSFLIFFGGGRGLLTEKSLLNL